MSGSRAVVSVLGGSSVGTPVLAEALAHAQLQGQMPPSTLRLFGRSRQRLDRVADHARYRVRRQNAESVIRVSTATSLEQAVSNADVVLCQIRPGGFEGRARDESLALSEGIPGDEGLGPGGLACFLRGRPVVAELAATVGRLSPSAPLLMMTSPLGLNVALARASGASKCIGVCELPATTLSRVLGHAREILDVGDVAAYYAGLNHQGFIYGLRGADGADCTGAFLNLNTDEKLVGVEPDVMRRIGAVPLPYLRLFYHADREVLTQRALPCSRGTSLARWASRAEAAYLSGEVPDHGQLERILSERCMDWYEAGVVPAIAACLSGNKTRIALNLPNEGALPGIDRNAVAELYCWLSVDGAEPIPVPRLPKQPGVLVQQLSRYEAKVLALPQRPGSEHLSEVLRLHPLVEDDAAAARLAHRLS